MRRGKPYKLTSQVATRTEQKKETDRKLAERLSALIEDANIKCLPLCKVIRKHVENMEEEDRDEAELVKNVKPLIEQAEKILNKTNGSIRGADPDNRLSDKATRNMQDHKATPEEQRLAEALQGGASYSVLLALESLLNQVHDSFPKAKKDLGPLLDAMSQPLTLTQIVGGVVLLLVGVLNLVGRLLSGLGLDSLPKGIVAATGLDNLYRGFGLDKWLKAGK
ncbi:hypothetical protein C8F04DRAFT_1223985 [Mycena alexandri]|uniref:DUF6987 domain-containing protein n=1 Tax=Mycena alexandri TaxID=1745969 RepID=A0AAD6S6N5_9AGAR|nr:hypothetical protein C8F04DRAFT_1223985 [Mycena alexandri]